MKNVLLTGGAGFIGHALILELLERTNYNIVCLDRLDSSGTCERIYSVIKRNKDYSKRLRFVFHDLKAPLNDYVQNKIGPVDYILHLAAGSHVDRSITHPLEFVMDNVVGTANLLEYCRNLTVRPLFYYFSTDEVFGPAPEGVFYKEWDRYHSGNPYSASKAGAEELCLAFSNTYKMPMVITHTMNVYGERQHPEKYIPLCIKRVMSGEKIYIHADKECKNAGKRHYIHTSDVCDAVLFLMNKWEKKELAFCDKYNVVGSQEVDNLQLAQMIAEYLDKDLNYQLVDFHSSSPGHDLRYSLCGEKMKKIGWEPKPLKETLRNTIDWYLNSQNKDWLF